MKRTKTTKSNTKRRKKPSAKAKPRAQKSQPAIDELQLPEGDQLNAFMHIFGNDEPMEEADRVPGPVRVSSNSETEKRKKTFLLAGNLS